VSTNRGISRFDTNTGTFKNFDVSDGLQGNEFNIRSGLRSANGEIIFGGNNGFNILQSTQLTKNTAIPPVVITDFRIFNQPVSIGGEDSPLQKQISETKKIRLSYRDAVFSFDFAALNFVSPEKNQYAYMMEGFDPGWNYVGSQRTATYTNLDPGDYVFRVKASNNDGIWNEQGASIAITIDPPFWKTWWAYLLEALLAMGVIAFVLNYFISRQRLRNALRIEHVELEKMYEMDQMKTQFFNNISHEFHSPMTLILSPLEKLVASRTTDGHMKKSLELVYRNARRLQRMTNQLRDFHKIETGDLQLQLSKGNIIQFIRNTALSFQGYAIDRRIRYQFKADQEDVFAWFDADKLDKIIYNLLSNAFKFTPDGGEIAVAVSVVYAEAMPVSHPLKDKASRYVEIVVQDSGIGIPEGKIEHVFQRFYHTGNHNGQHYEGSGVGLAFAYELVKFYQGEISVFSEEGHGAKFTVQIPLDEQFLEENQLVGEFNVAPLETANGRDLAAADGQSSFNAELNKQETPVILIVDDDEEVRNYVRDSLGVNHRIFCAGDGLEGCKKATKLIPDLIVTDIKMPEMSGIEMCNQVKEDERTSHIPVILLTAYSTKDNQIAGLRKGTDAYVAKPFSIDVLEAQITNLLESRRKLREKYSRQILLEPKKVTVTDIDEKFLIRVMEIVEKHISDTGFNAEALSKEAGMSRMQLYRKLRGLTDQTVHEFIRNIRLKRAVQLLEAKRMTITEVAYEVGFNDLTYFARCFRKQYQKSPSEYVSGKN
jgi:signal transduction histidine kinase/DNA-binding response OmpR family regulator